MTAAEFLSGQSYLCDWQDFNTAEKECDNKGNYVLRSWGEQKTFYLCEEHLYAIAKAILDRKRLSNT